MEYGTPQAAVYIMTNKQNGTLYVGVTSDLRRRTQEHRSGMIPGFTAKYGCKILVFYQLFGSMELAIAREKQIKGGSRIRKLQLIEQKNPGWEDLANNFID